MEEKELVERSVSEADAREAMRLASHKLPIKSKFVKKSDLDAATGGEA